MSEGEEEDRPKKRRMNLKTISKHFANILRKTLDKKTKSRLKEILNRVLLIFDILVQISH